MADKTSLEKSHSKASNAKLTFICFIAALAVSMLWVGIALFGSEAYRIFGIILASVGAVLTLLSLFLISKFTR
ncbi:MAG: hypothetical protein II788_05130 [Acholeplasmatales bacterium]|nr:hypothetical protein [Acholeplasmatales bacterium]